MNRNEAYAIHITEVAVGIYVVHQSSSIDTRLDLPIVHYDDFTDADKEANRILNLWHGYGEGFQGITSLFHPERPAYRPPEPLPPPKKKKFLGLW